ACAVLEVRRGQAKELQARRKLEGEYGNALRHDRSEKHRSSLANVEDGIDDVAVRRRVGIGRPDHSRRLSPSDHLDELGVSRADHTVGIPSRRPSKGIVELRRSAYRRSLASCRSSTRIHNPLTWSRCRRVVALSEHVAHRMRLVAQIVKATSRLYTPESPH